MIDRHVLQEGLDAIVERHQPLSMDHHDVPGGNPEPMSMRRHPLASAAIAA